MTVAKIDSKGNRLFKGERERSDGRYEYRYRDHKGELCSLYANRLQSLRLEEAKVAFKEQKSILSGLNELTLNDVYEVWLAGKVALKENTLSGYKYTYDSYVRDSLGKESIEDIKTADVKAFYIKLKLERSLSTETICRIQNILFQVFQNAVDSDIIWKNPADRATKEIKRSHSKHSSTRAGLNEKEANRLTAFIFESPELRDWYPIIYVMIHTGLRLGEIVSLRWCDVNLSKHYLEINHTASYYVKDGEGARYHFSEGAKTVAGNRRIPFDNSVKEAFEMEREILARKNIICTQKIDGYTDFVFLNRFGKMFDQRAINKALTRIVELYNLSAAQNIGDEDLTLPHISCHSLRHTYAVILCERGVNIKVMQMLLGHRDISTTMDIYTKVSQEYLFEEYARRMENEIAT